MGLQGKTKWKVFIRSFFVQACWNYETMQSAGFLYSLLPGLEELYGDEEGKLEDAAMRHAEFFNTHPYFASHLVGMSLAMEEKIKVAELDPASVNAAKVGLMGSLGAIGDSYFWGSLKPLASLLSVLIALLNPYMGALFLLIFYNVFHFRTRMIGFTHSIRSPEGVYQYLRKNDFAGRNEYIRAFILIFLGIYLGYFISRTLPPDEGFVLASIHFGLSIGLVVALEFVYRKIAAISEIIVFSSLFLFLISLTLR